MRALLAVAGVVLGGAGIASAGSRERGALRAVLAVALGLGTSSLAYAVVLLSFGPRWMMAKDVALTIAGLVLLIAARRHPRSGPDRPKDPAPRWLVVLFAAACLVAAAAIAEHMARFPDGGWDAAMVWNLRARFLLRGGEAFAVAFSRDLLPFAHADYPFLLPGLVAQGFSIAGEHAAVSEVLAAAFGALLLAVAASGVGRLCGQRFGILAGVAIAAVPCFAVFVADQQSDVPLAVYLLAACVLVELDALPLAGYAAGLAAWTKNEGALYAALLAVALFVRTRDARRLARFAFGAAPCALLLAGFKLGIVPKTDLFALSTSQSVLAHAADLRRWGELAVRVLRQTVYFQDLALWAVAELLLVVFWMRRQPPSVPGTALALICAAYVPLYVLQPYPLRWMIGNSADRIFIQLWPAGVLATSLPLARTTAHT